MKVLVPTDVTSTGFVSSNVVETIHGAWNNSYVFSAGTKVSLNHRVYESLIAGNVGKSPDVSPDSWLDLGPTNGWAMFDQAHSSSTTNSTLISVSLNLGAVNDIVLSGVVGSTITVVVGGSTVRTVNVPALVVPATSATVVIQNLGLTGQFTVNLSGSGEVAICNISSGTFYDVGPTPDGVDVSLFDFSVRETSKYGITALQKRKYAKKTQMTLEIPNSSLDAVRAVMKKLKSKVCYWHASDTFTSLNSFSKITDSGSVIDQPTTSKVSLTLESLAVDDVYMDPGQQVEGATLSSGLSLDLTSDSQILAADISGVVSSFAGATTTLRVLVGGEDQTSSWSITKLDSGCTSSLTGSTVSVSAVSADNSYVQITASKPGFPTLTKRFNLTRMRLTDLGQNSYRVVSTGASVVNPPAAAGAYVNGTLVKAGSRSYNLVTIHRTTKAMTTATYDVFGDAAQATALVAALAALNSNYVVMVLCQDEPQGNRMANGLPAALYRCGASRAVFGSPSVRYRSSYILVGIPGCGEGNGIEAYQGSVDSDPNAWCDVSFTMIGTSITGASQSYTPKTLQDYGYTGDMDATKGATWSEVTNRPADSRILNNLIDTSWWRVGAAASENGWGQNPGATNSFQNGSGADGSSTALWTATSTQAQANGGGWDPGGGNLFTPDVTKAYRFVVPIFVPDSKVRHLYWGVSANAVCYLNTTTLHDNPYFAYANLSADLAGTPGWYLAVGYVFPYGSNMNHAGAGLYRLSDGALVRTGTNHTWPASPSITGTRAYQYYQNTIGAQVQWDRPSVEVCDGSERSLAALLAAGAVSARNKIVQGNISNYIGGLAVDRDYIANGAVSSSELIVSSELVQGSYVYPVSMQAGGTLQVLAILSHSAAEYYAGVPWFMSATIGVTNSGGVSVPGSGTPMQAKTNPSGGAPGQVVLSFLSTTLVSAGNYNVNISSYFERPYAGMAEPALTPRWTHTLSILRTYK